MEALAKIYTRAVEKIPTTHTQSPPPKKKNLKKKSCIKPQLMNIISEKYVCSYMYAWSIVFYIKNLKQIYKLIYCEIE